VEVKAFARNLVEGLLTDTITKTLSDLDLSVQEEGATDISLSLAADEDDDDNTVAAAVGGADDDDASNSLHLDYSSQVETDSLEEKSPKKVARVTKE
jgi:hypothetical protein